MKLAALSANTAAVPIRVMMSPASGGTDRTRHIHADRPQRRGRAQLRTRNQFGDERLIGRGGEGRTHPEGEGQHQQQRWTHLACTCEDSQHHPHRRHVHLDRDQHAPAIERVRQHPAREGEENDGKSAGRLDERDKHRCIGLVNQEQLGAHGLHPRADVADQNRQPDRAKGTTCQGRPWPTPSRSVESRVVRIMRTRALRVHVLGASFEKLSMRIATVRRRRGPSLRPSPQWPGRDQLGCHRQCDKATCALAAHRSQPRKAPQPSSESRSAA